jgi:hypothetical protein
MDDKRNWVLRNAFCRNLEQTFHKDQIDMTKETRRVRREEFLSRISDNCAEN